MTDPVTRYRLSFSIPALPELPQKRRHWRTINRAAKRWREAVALVVGSRRPAEPLRRARITLTRCSSVEPDYDNLVASFKPVVDALTRSRKNHKGDWIMRADVLADDTPKILDREYRWEHAPRGKGVIGVKVEEMPC